MRLTQLRSFHAVATTGSFTGAAEKLHVSQPTVTTQIRNLESHYGVEFLFRTVCAARTRSTQISTLPHRMPSPTDMSPRPRRSR